MTRESTLYFIAAGLFAVAAGISVGSGRTIGVAPVLMMATAVVFAWLGARKRASTR